MTGGEIIMGGIGLLLGICAGVVLTCVAIERSPVITPRGYRSRRELADIARWQREREARARYRQLEGFED